MNKYLLNLLKFALLFTFFNREQKKSIRKTFEYFIEIRNKKFDNGEFFIDKTEHNTILIVEPNPYHGETLTGYIKYCLDLGYNVDVIINPKLLEEKVFGRCDFDNKVRLYIINPLSFFTLFNSKKMLEYKNILFLSSIPSYLPWIKNKQIFNKILIVEHHLDAIKNDKSKEIIYGNGKIIVLTNFKNDKNLNMVNPHYFGDINFTGKSNTTINFITIGRLNTVVKNSNLILESIENLLKQNITNFKVTVIGSGTLDGIKNEIKEYIDIKGRLNFPDMFNELEKADFFLPLLDPESPKNREYLSKLTTGSAQLVLGFLKPFIINEEFANVYYFDDTNAITYKKNEISEAMKKAINITDEEYIQLQNNIRTLAEKRYQKSLDNLKKLVSNA